MGKSWHAVAGRTTNLAGGTGLIYLPLIAPGALQPVSPTNDTVLTFPPSVISNNPALVGVSNGEAVSIGGGGGSGGGIQIATDSLSGAGSITANGGSGGSNSGGGGGGRIAMVYSGNTLPTTVRIESAAGGGPIPGGSGTVYLKLGTNVGQTLIRGTGRETPLADFVPGELVIVDGARVFAQRIETGELRLTNGAVLTHRAATTNTELRLELVVSNIVISTNSAIDVTGRGYLGYKSGNPDNSGRTLGNVPGSTTGNGGSHGGLGGNGSFGGTPNGLYGDYRNPNELGSGGGGFTSQGGSYHPGGNGGGLVRIISQQLILHETISANGEGGSAGGGGGSGGGIKITTESLSGVGSITANGGNATAGGNSGGGGGGRIAIFYTTTTSSVLTNAQALGGTGFAAGSPGTVHHNP